MDELIREFRRMTPEQAARRLAFHYRNDWPLLKPMVRAVRLALAEMR